MKPKPKGRSSYSTDQSIRQHEAGSCYDFTKVSKALRLAHNSLNNDVVDHCSNSIVMKDESAPRPYDFKEMSEALLSFLKTRENMIRSEPLKERKAKLVNVKTAIYNFTSRSLRKRS
ncbi:hypothetical protein D8674_030875 [Pyrus ussuriensis x Pyrus communis]|uniref:Uncharacterized protein n=1 Tax=Pyrus ussuriensis x Pyrus communis TaxID=2448454 RepID=A0A5N5EXE7_9ROSA|nr:hypothetical protein D8674_030875 [Pyrus ussuriensis x Pyrus communis]